MSDEPRPTLAPDAPRRTVPPVDTRETTPPDGTPAAAAVASHTWPDTVDRTVDALTRRALRAAVGWWVYDLQRSGHLDAQALCGLVACAVGVEAAVRAWRERRVGAAAAVVLPLALAALGEIAHHAALTHSAGYVAAALVPFVGVISRRLP